MTSTDHPIHLIPIEDGSSVGWKLKMDQEKVEEWIAKHLTQKGKDERGTHAYLNEQETVDLCNNFLQVPQSANGSNDSYSLVKVFGEKGKKFIINKLTDKKYAQKMDKSVSISIPTASQFILLHADEGSSSMEGINMMKEEEIVVSDSRNGEQFTNRFISELSDTVLLVVNELAQIDEEVFRLLKDRYNPLPIFVVHNFKTTKDNANYIDYRGFVQRTYNESLQKVHFNDFAIDAEYLHSEGVYHFFLCQEGTTAGDEINPGTLFLINSLLDTLAKPERIHPIIDIIRSSSLTTKFYYPDIDDDIIMRYHKDNFEISLVSSSRNSKEENKKLRESNNLLQTQNKYQFDSIESLTREMEELKIRIASLSDLKKKELEEEKNNLKTENDILSKLTDRLKQMLGVDKLQILEEVRRLKSLENKRTDSLKIVEDFRKLLNNKKDVSQSQDLVVVLENVKSIILKSKSFRDNAKAVQWGEIGSAYQQWKDVIGQRRETFVLKRLEFIETVLSKKEYPTPEEIETIFADAVLYLQS
eukprot:TRINITY_DN11238_c0_g1_i1.p1 TRINITY_DN11238_c0_g1~~TRINITY_DN11238_c0_g1_i1.p1  ORF type:complete len:530 (-),score=149.90 TRINITY_DN11238_c0_g1_i1:99-1688(-)